MIKTDKPLMSDGVRTKLDNILLQVLALKTSIEPLSLESAQEHINRRLQPEFQDTEPVIDETHQKIKSGFGEMISEIAQLGASERLVIQECSVISNAQLKLWADGTRSPSVKLIKNVLKPLEEVLNIILQEDPNETLARHFYARVVELAEMSTLNTGTDADICNISQKVIDLYDQIQKSGDSSIDPMLNKHMVDTLVRYIGEFSSTYLEKLKEWSDLGFRGEHLIKELRQVSSKQGALTPDECDLISNISSALSEAARPKYLRRGDHISTITLGAATDQEAIGGNNILEFRPKGGDS